VRSTKEADPVTLASDQLDERVYGKIIRRFVPLLTLCFLANYIDRTNVGFAALSMNQAIGLSDLTFGWGAGVLFIGYCLFEVPSNLLLYRVGARLWLARIMITWGLCSAATAFVTGPASFYGMRFLLGVAEAGFNPGVMFFFLAWFPSQYRGRMFAWFQMAIPLSAVISAPLSTSILAMDGVLKLGGWQWMFILEGLPSIILGIVLLFVLTNRPDEAAWLSADERASVSAALARETPINPSHNFLAVIRDPRVLLLAAVQLGFTAGSYGIGIWLPLILKERHLSVLTIGVLATVPYLCGCVATVLWAAAADRSGRRVANLAVTCALGGAGLLAAVWVPGMAAGFIGLTIAVVGVTSARGIFWSLPPQFLVGRGAASGLAFVSSIGAFGGFLGPSLMGWLKQATGSFTAGLTCLALCIALSGVLTLLLPAITHKTK
jgi:ACS family tartrate transporter-like MFS transporter